MTVEEQQRRCGERARVTSSAADYQCQIVSKKSQGLRIRSAAEARENSLDSIDELRALRSQPSPQTIAPQCSQGYSNPFRFISCSLDDWVVTNTRIVNGVPMLIGQMNLTIESSVEFDEPLDGSRSPSWDLDSEVRVTYTWGNLVGGASGSVWTGCWGHPDKCVTQSGNSENETVFLGPGSLTTMSYLQYSRTLALDDVNPLYGSLGSAVLVNTPAGQVILVDHRDNTLWGRCDGIQNR